MRVRGTTTAQSRRAAAVLASAVAFEVFLVAQTLDERALTATESAVFAVASTLATTACTRRARRESGALRQGWGLLALAVALYTAAEVGYVVESVLRDPFPESGDWYSNAFADLTIPVAALALVRLASTAAVTRPLLTVLDGLVTGLAWLFISWALVLGPAYRDTTGGDVEQRTLLYFLAGSLALVGLVLALAMRWAGDTVTLGLLAVAFSWLAVTQVVYALRVIEGSYRVGDPLVDVGWLVPVLMLWLAANRTQSATREQVKRRRVLLTLTVPYASVVIAAAAFFVLVLMGEELDLFLEVTGVTTVLLIIARFSLTARENHALTTDLEQQVMQRTLEARVSEARLQALLRNSSDVIAVVDQEDRFAYVNPAARHVLGQPPDRLIGQSLLAVVHPDDRAAVTDCLEEVRQEDAGTKRLAFRLSGPQGRWCHAEATVVMPHRDPQISGPVLNIRDVSDRAALEDELRTQATYDPLTGLGNRRLLHDRVRHALDRGARHDEPQSLIYLDLDHFKRINDTAGHAAGDAVLLQVADRLRTTVRPADTAVRLGGDEFAVLLEDTTEEQAREVADRVLAALQPPFLLGERPITVTASVGVTTARSRTSDGEALLRDADVAMYQAKAGGRARLAVFEPEMQEELVEQMELERDLREALARRRLRLQYQPVLDLRTGSITGVEALLRWRSEAEDDVSPSLFIPLAEERGLIQQLDSWVLRAACRQVRHWQTRFPAHQTLRVSVNLSPHDLRDPGLVDLVRGVLEDTELEPETLVLEITETSVLPDPSQLRDTLYELRALGVGIALDDFGTGYGSLAALRSLPLDEVKIDRSFVAGMEASPAGRRFVEAIIQLARALDVQTVAEAIETPSQLAWLQRMHCGAGQGYLLSPPLEPADMTRVLRNGGIELPSVRRRLRRPSMPARPAVDAGR